MDAQQFLFELGHIANAPGGIIRLRQMITHLAVQGGLVPQIAREEPAVKLISRVSQGRDNYAGKRRTLSFNAPADKALRLPDGWSLTPLQVIANPQAGFAFKSGLFNDSGSGLPIIRVRDVGVSSPKTYFSGKYRPEFLVTQGDWLIAMDGDFRVAKWDGPTALLNQRVSRLQFYSNEISSRYVSIALQIELRKLQGIKAYTTVDHLSSKQIAASLIRLPPKEEQSRIVAKVDELMTLCDKLEVQQLELRKLQNALRQSTLQAVVAATSPHELQTTWARLEVNFGRLFSTPEDARDFKELVLDLAVAGLLLSPAKHHKSSGSALLDAIVARRNKWAKSAEEQEQKEALAMLKKLRTQSVVPPTDSLPAHWCWAPLLQVSQAVVDCHNKTAPYVEKGIHLIRTTDIRNGRMELRKTKKVSEETYAYWARRITPKAGDIFFTREAPMGEAAIVPTGEKVCLGQRTMLIRLFPELFSNRFLLYTIQSPSFQTRMIEAAIGMTVKHLRVGGVEDLMVPVPPKQEQDRIVEIVDRLFQICDRYVEYLEKRQKIASNLALTAVAALIGSAIEQEEERPVKAPQTQVVAPLRLGTPPDLNTQAPLATLLARHNGEMLSRDLWQRFDGEIDAFYAQLKTEVAHGWIEEPTMAEVREQSNDVASA